MDWIKRNYDQFILGLVALILLVLSGFLIQSAWSFQEIFAGIRGQVVHNNTIPPVEMTGIQQAVDGLKNSARWEKKPDQGSLFVSIPYVMMSGTLENPQFPGAAALHPPVPNQWIIDHNLDILDNNVLNEDPSGDGFSNLDKWKGLKGDGSDSYDPQDPKSHPPYYTKLRLLQYIKVPFRLEFNAWDGDPAKPDTLQFQINTLDVNQPTQFRKIGELIEGTKFKIIKFEPKQVNNPKTGSTLDVSELTVQNTENGNFVILVIEKIADSPDSFAQFQYLWNNTQIRVKKGEDFVLLPETTLRYKLIDIQEDQALIQIPTGQQVKVPHLERP